MNNLTLYMGEYVSDNSYINKLDLCMKTINSRPDWFIVILSIVFTASILLIAFWYLYHNRYIIFNKP